MLKCGEWLADITADSEEGEPLGRLAVALTVLLSSLGGWAARASGAVGEDAGFVAQINTSRAAAGLNPLLEHWDLVDDARRHTTEMMTAGSLFHSSTDQLTAVTVGWSLIGENVGRGSDVDGLHQAFMDSPTHRDNVLGDYSFVGVASDRTPEGALYVTVLFMQVPTSAPTTVPFSAAAPSAVPSAMSSLSLAPATAAQPQLSWRPIDSHWIRGELCVARLRPVCAI